MISLIGIAGLILIAWLASTNRRSINLRTVGVAFAIQIGVGGLVLYFPLGKHLLSNLAEGVSGVLGFSQAGINFLFGNLADQSWSCLLYTSDAADE